MWKLTLSCSIMQFHWFYIIQCRKLQRIKQTNIIWVASAEFVLFSFLCKSLYVFASPIILSMWTRLLEIWRSCTTVAAFILFVFLKNVGMLTEMKYGSSMSWILKPLSAITSSPGSHRVMISDLSTIWRSLVEPPYAGDKYDMRPPGTLTLITFVYKTTYLSFLCMLLLNDVCYPN